MGRMCNDCGVTPIHNRNQSGCCGRCYNRNRPRNKKGSDEHKAHLAEMRNRYAKNIDKERARARTYRFSLTEEQINLMRANQNYSCALCDRHEDEVGTLHIDHDHSCCNTSKNERTCGLCVRGLLCRSCNHGLGNFSDSIELLLKAIEYIRGYK